MRHEQLDLAVVAWVERQGEAFAVFDSATQDSGNVSYGVLDAGGRRWFVKTAGAPTTAADGSTHAQRVARLLHAACVQADVDHPALARIEAVVQAADGVVLVHEWFDGELLRTPPEQRDDPDTAHRRFRRLPAQEAVMALGQVVDLHVQLERAGWVAGDFYDGALMYDFDRHRMKVIDLEAYHRGAFVNETGRLPGSTRFMAPEESTRGARVDARTTVFNLARMLQILLPDGAAGAVVDLVRAATSPEPDARPATVADLQRSWRRATGTASP